MGLATPARCLPNSGLQRGSIATLNGLLVAYPDKLPQKLALCPCRRKYGKSFERVKFLPKEWLLDRPPPLRVFSGRCRHMALARIIRISPPGPERVHVQGSGRN
jgi:hypothetical protein